MGTFYPAMDGWMDGWMDGLHYMLPVAGKSANERKRVTIAHLSRDQRQGRGVRTHEPHVPRGNESR